MGWCGKKARQLPVSIFFSVARKKKSFLFCILHVKASPSHSGSAAFVVLKQILCSVYITWACVYLSSHFPLCNPLRGPSNHYLYPQKSGMMALEPKRGGIWFVSEVVTREREEWKKGLSKIEYSNIVWNVREYFCRVPLLNFLPRRGNISIPVAQTLAILNVLGMTFIPKEWIVIQSNVFILYLN